MLIRRKPAEGPTSQKKIDANRRNALKSRGPVSARGRAVSSQNARKYKLLPFENPSLPAQLTAQYFGRYIPTTRNERRLVNIMVFSERVRRNCMALEDRVVAEDLADTGRRSRKKTLAVTSRLLAIGYRCDAAECAYGNALRQLEAVRTKAA